MRRSVFNNALVKRSLSPAARTATATGDGVDRLQGVDGFFRTAMVVVATGAVTDATHTIEVQDSDDDSTYAAVADKFLQGTEPAIVAADDDKVFEIGYTGHKRFLRVVSTVSGTPTTGAVLGAVVVLDQGGNVPVTRS